MNNFSSYYRRITELLPRGLKDIVGKSWKLLKPAVKMSNLKFYLIQYAYLFLAIFFIFTLIQGTLLYFNYLELKEKRSDIQNSLSYWEEIIEKHPNSPDAYYNAAIYAASLKEKQKAEDYIEKAIKLDPDFEEATKLRGSLNLGI